MNTIDQHFETVIITSMIAKQEVIIQCLDGNVVKGFIHPSIDPEGFSVGEQYVRWETINSIELTDHYFEFWKDILPKGDNPFDEEVLYLCIQ